ncbi:hypothetical protein L596_007928 [Steinernema carpocapsae]|uniref:Uncharacterized protein n=1 Tax=Steinernema carpocapsae TaxID=34508 RepID=A0A4U5PAW1_STECR|nr:hypothetical protein L596_007928 [Steinernema carpocapsae]
MNEEAEANWQQLNGHDRSQSLAEVPMPRVDAEVSAAAVEHVELREIPGGEGDLLKGQGVAHDSYRDDGRHGRDALVKKQLHLPIGAKKVPDAQGSQNQDSGGSNED